MTQLENSNIINDLRCLIAHYDEGLGCLNAGSMVHNIETMIGMFKECGEQVDPKFVADYNKSVEEYEEYNEVEQEEGDLNPDWVWDGTSSIAGWSDHFLKKHSK